MLNGIIAQNAVIAVAAATVKTVLQYAAPAGLDARLRGFWLGFDSATATDAAAVVKLLRQDPDGTGSAYTIQHEDPRIVAATYVFGGTAKHTFTAEPTTATLNPVIRTMHLDQKSGGWDKVFADPIVIPRGTAVGLVITATANCNVLAGLLIGE